MTLLAGDIIALYRQTDPVTREIGRRWYDRSKQDVNELARLAPRGVGPSRTAAILAALSPQTQWSKNWEWAREVVLAAAAGGNPPTIGGFPRNREKAWRIAGGADPDKVLGGPKVRAFWRALAGDPDACVLDIWMFRAFGYPDNVTAKVYAEITEVMERAAAHVGESVRDLQAIIWLQTRGVRPADPIRYLEVAP
jgi:hypothetical protein